MEIPGIIGVGVSTSGKAQLSSLEVFQAARLGIETYNQNSKPPLGVQPFYGACLPGEQASSAAEMAATYNILVVLGPTCVENSLIFTTHMFRSGKAMLSPVSWALPAGSGMPGLAPKISDLRDESLRWLNFLAFSNMVFIPASDLNSLEFSEAICSALNSASNRCVLLQPGEDLPPNLHADAIIEVDLGEDGLPGLIWQEYWPGLLRVKITLARPLAGVTDQHWDYWIAPRIWEESQNLLHLFRATYQTEMTSMAGIASFQAVQIVEQSLQGAAIRMWDGSYLVPRQAFSQELLDTASQHDLFRNNCDLEIGGCPSLSLALFRLHENEYRLAKP